MKNKNMSRRFYARIGANIGYSALIACMVEIFLVTNVSIISRYLEETGRERGMMFLLSPRNGDVLGILVYVILGILVKSEAKRS